MLAKGGNAKNLALLSNRAEELMYGMLGVYDYLMSSGGDSLGYFKHMYFVFRHLMERNLSVYACARYDKYVVDQVLASKAKFGDIDQVAAGLFLHGGAAEKQDQQQQLTRQPFQMTGSTARLRTGRTTTGNTPHCSCQRTGRMKFVFHLIRKDATGDARSNIFAGFVILSIAYLIANLPLNRIQRHLVCDTEVVHMTFNMGDKLPEQAIGHAMTSTLVVIKRVFYNICIMLAIKRKILV